MKKYGLLLIVVVLIAGVIVLMYKQKNNSNYDFNIKKGDVIVLNDTKITVLNVASTLCEEGKTCYADGEVEVSVKVLYNEEESSYTLKSTTNPKELIKNSNNYIILTYENGKLNLNVKDKRDI